MGGGNAGGDIEGFMFGVFGCLGACDGGPNFPSSVSPGAWRTLTRLSQTGSVVRAHRRGLAQIQVDR